MKFQKTDHQLKIRHQHLMPFSPQVTFSTTSPSPCFPTAQFKMSPSTSQSDNKILKRLIFKSCDKKLLFMLTFTKLRQRRIFIENTCTRQFSNII